MHITHINTNAQQALMMDPDSKGIHTVQEGTETTEIYKTHFLSLGEIIKIHKIEANEKPTSESYVSIAPLTKLATSVWNYYKSPFHYLPVSECTIDISLWKIVALVVAVLPVLFIRALFCGGATSILTREIKVEKVQIEISRDHIGDVSIATVKRPVIYLNGVVQSTPA